MNIRFAGTGSAIPNKTMTNYDISKIVETSDEWILSRTGIRERHIAEETDCLSSLATEAAQKALEAADISATNIDLIIVGTATADKNFPSCSCEVQAAIGATRAVCMDVSAACSSFLFAMHAAESMMRAAGYKRAIIIGADIMSRHLDWNDRGTCILFGDGAGAAVLVADTENDFNNNTKSDILATILGSDGTRGACLTCNTQGDDPFVHMGGQEVFKFAVRTVPEVIVSVLEQAGKSKDEVSLYILHQANERILEAVAKRLGQKMDKFPMNLDKLGNTSAASVPILLDDINKRGDIKRGDLIVLAGFGAGLTWGASVIKW